MIIEELKNSIKRNPRIFLCMIIYLVIIFLSLEILFVNIVDIYDYSDSSFEQVSDKQYRLVDFANTSSLIKDYDSVVDLKKFHSELSASNNYIFYEGIIQPTSLASFKGDPTFLYNYEENQTNPNIKLDSLEYSSVKQILINFNTMKAINIGNKIIEGRAFKEDDFILKDYNRIPVILGYDYLKYYKTGELIEGKLLKDLKCIYEVVGFLNKDTNIIINDEMVFLDRYILSPSLNIDVDRDPLSNSELMYQGFSYLQKINGTIKLMNNYTIKDFLMELESLRLEYNIFDISILKYSMLQTNALKFLVYENAKTLLFMFVLTLIFSIITIFIYIVYKIRLNMYFYKVYLLCGYGIIDIKKIIISEILVPLSASLILSIAVLNILMHEILLLSLLFILSIFIVVLSLSLIIIHKYFYNVTIEKFTEGEEND